MKKLFSVKKIITTVLALLFLVNLSITSYAVPASHSIQDTLNQILLEYPNGSYFSVNGKRCEHGSDKGCNNCRLASILKSKGERMVDPGRQSATCWAFVRYISIKLYGWDSLYNFSSQHPNGVKTIANGSTKIASTFSDAQVGDILWFYSNEKCSGNPGHMGIFMGSDATGIWLYDNNIGGREDKEDGTPGYTGTVRYDHVNYGSLPRKFCSIKRPATVATETPTAPASPTITSTVSGQWKVTVGDNYKVLCYSSADATKNSTYVKAQPSYSILCTQKATLSNGKIRYFFVSNDRVKKSLWFDYDANYMSVTGSQGETSQKQYTVYFDPNGGIVSQSSKTVAAGSIVGSMPTPTREGYTFLGWTYSQGGSAGLLLRTGDEMFVEKDITLYAEWKEIQASSKTYEVILDNGSTCKTITVTNGGTYGSLPTPSRDGYTFDGWYTQASGGSKITASTKVNLTSSQTLYARWIQNAVHKHEKINPTVSPEHPHYTFYTCSCGEVFTDNVENSVDSCLVCALGQLGDDMINSAIPEPPKGYWSTWSNWSTASASVSDTRQVETRTITEQVKISDGYTEYRYGGYATSDGRHECWCETYLRNKFGSSNIRYTDWNTTRYKVNGTSWTCGNCSGNHVYVDHYGNDGRAWWPEYTLPNGKNYYWEESRTVDAQYETREVTQYRYRDWVAS